MQPSWEINAPTKHTPSQFRSTNYYWIPTEKPRPQPLMPAALAVRAYSLVRHIARAALHPVVHAHLAHRSQRFVIERRHAQRRPQLLIKLPQVLQMGRQRRHLHAFIGNQKFLIARVPHPSELPLEHHRRQNRHLKLPFAALPELRAAAILLHAHHPARAAHGESQRRQRINGLLPKLLVDIPHSPPRVRFPASSVKSLAIRRNLASERLDPYPDSRISGSESEQRPPGPMSRREGTP